MLTSMRKNSKILNIFLWLVIIAFLATIFVVWGLGEKQSDMNYAAKVDDYVINYTEYRNEYDRLSAQMKAIFGDQADELIREDKSFGFLVLNNIINQHLLLREAERLGVPVSDAEVAENILQSPVFYKNGQFDIELYQLVLYNNRLTPAAYEAQIRKELTISKMKQIVDDSVAVTDIELENEFKYQNTKVEASYFTVSTAGYKAEEPTAEELDLYFLENQERYRQAAKISLKYTVFDPETFVYTFTMSDDDLHKRYEASIGSFTEPESLELSQIVVFIENPNDENSVLAAETKIKEAQAMLNSGRSFAEVASEYSDFPGEAGDGYLGRVTKPENGLDAIDQALFSAEDGEITDIIKEGFAFFIFKVDGRQAAKVIPFEEVKDGLRQTIEEQERASAFRNRMYTLYRDVFNTGNITAYLAQNPAAFDTVEVGPLAENDLTAFFQYDAELKKTLFSLSQSDLSPLMDFNGQTYMYEVVEKTNSYIPELDEVKEQVKADYMNSFAFNAAVAGLDETITVEAMASEEFNTAAKGFNAVVKAIPAFTRAEPSPELVWASELSSWLFRQKEDDIIKYPVRGEAVIYVVRVDKIIKPDMSDMDLTTKDALEGYLLSTKRQDALMGTLANLKKKHKVIINERFLENQ